LVGGRRLGLSPRESCFIYLPIKTFFRLLLFRINPKYFELGAPRSVPLLQVYYNAESREMNLLHRNGVEEVRSSWIYDTLKKEFDDNGFLINIKQEKETPKRIWLGSEVVTM